LHQRGELIKQESFKVSEIVQAVADADCVTAIVKYDLHYASGYNKYPNIKTFFIFIKTIQKMKSSVGLNQTDQRICKRFRKTRIDAQETQATFAKKLGCNVPYVKAVEQEKFVPNFQIMRKWKAVYKKKYDWIIDGK